MAERFRVTRSEEAYLSDSASISNDLGTVDAEKLLPKRQHPTLTTLQEMRKLPW